MVNSMAHRPCATALLLYLNKEEKKELVRSRACGCVESVAAQGRSASGAAENGWGVRLDVACLTTPLTSPPPRLRMSSTGRAPRPARARIDGLLIALQL